MSKFFWTGYYNGSRHAGINDIQNIVTKYGDVVDFKLFSDISITLVIEAKELNIDKMYNDLSNSISIDPFNLLNSKSQKERTIFLNITFAKGTGDLRIEVPSVPG